MQVCSVCGTPLSGDFGGSRSDTYASFNCSHGPSGNYDYDRGTGNPGAPAISHGQYQSQFLVISSLQQEIENLKKQVKNR